MTICLYECLRAIGLQRHYERFTAMGINSAFHLLALTMEDYPVLGILTMEDRTRLFQLVQQLKTLDPESLGYENGEDDDHCCDEADSTLTCKDMKLQNVKDKDATSVDKLNAAAFTKSSSVRRRLDFSCEDMDRHQKISQGTAHDYTNQNRTDGSVPGKRSAVPTELSLCTGSATTCGCRHRIETQGTSDLLIGRRTKTDITEVTAEYSAPSRSSTKRVSVHTSKPRSATIASEWFSNKPVVYKERKLISLKEKPFKGRNFNRLFRHIPKPASVYESINTAGYNYGLPQSPPSVSNKKQAGVQRITVCVRKRPLTHTELRSGEVDVVTTTNGECVFVHESKEAVDLTQYIHRHRFYFDEVFGEENTNEEVYQRTAFPLVQHMLNGGKATCFAYGQTGAGKTHTMLGSSPGRPGLYALAVRDIFAHLSSSNPPSSMLVYVSFFEIYCGQLYDLLDHRKRLFAREDGQRVVHIAGLRNVKVDSVKSLLEVIARGSEERTQGVSGVNPLSSRSHALLQIQLKTQNQQVTGRMWFVDLAGSERASDTKEPDRQSRMEGAEINQSLLALKECIRSLDQEQSHTPFRQSKLTQVLKDSFVGDTMTCMIANISPGYLATEHTLNTLRYADRVKELRGQGVHKAGNRWKTTPSPKCNLSISNSSISNKGSSAGARGKSPPKKPKMGSQSGAFGPTLLSSNAKSSKQGRQPNAIVGNRTVLDQISTAIILPGTKNKRQRGAREERARLTEDRFVGTGCYSVSDQNEATQLMLTQPTAEQPSVGGAQRGDASYVHLDSGLFHLENEKKEKHLKREGKVGRRHMEQKKQVESKQGTPVELEMQRRRDIHKCEENVTEKERHLKWYHQQLQQLVLSSTSSTGPSSSSTFLRSSLDSQSLCSSPRHSSNFQTSDKMYHSLEEVVNGYRGRVKVRADDLRRSMPCDENWYDAAGKDQISWKGTETKFRQGRSRRDKRRSLDAPAVGDIGIRIEDRNQAGIERREIRHAWGPAGESDRSYREADATSKNAMAVRSYSWDAKRTDEVSQEGMDTSLGRVLTSEDGDPYQRTGIGLSKNFGPFSNPPSETLHQQAPAERPLSPASDCSKMLPPPGNFNDFSPEPKDSSPFNKLPLLRQNAQVDVQSKRKKENEQQFGVNVDGQECVDTVQANPPSAASITQNICKESNELLKKSSEMTADTQPQTHQVVKANVSAPPQEKASVDCLKYTLDPLRVPILGAGQQSPAASLIQGEETHTSLCLHANERENHKKEEEKQTIGTFKDEETEFALLELPQRKTRWPLTSDILTTSHLNEPTKDGCVVHKHCGIGVMEHLASLILLSLHAQRSRQTSIGQSTNEEPAGSPCNTSPHTSLETNSPSDAGSHSSNGQLSNDAKPVPVDNTCDMTSKDAILYSLPPPESVLHHSCSMLNHCHSVCTVYPPTTSHHINGPTDRCHESASNQEMMPTIHTPAVGNRDQNQQSVIQAHWEQLEEMEALCHKESTLLCQQPDMPFAEYVEQLEEIMEKKAHCVHSMRTHLQSYIKKSPSFDHKSNEDQNLKGSL